MKFRMAHHLFRHASGALLAFPLALAANQGFAQGVTEDMLLNAHKETNNWRMVGRDYMSTRFSPLNQVNTKTVKRLVPKWTFSFGVLDAQNTTPLIHNGVMYVTASHGRTFAVNAKTGAMIWQWMVVLPDHRAGLRVDREGAAVRGSDIHHAVMDKRRGVLRVEHAEGKCPLRDQALDSLGVDLVQGAEARAHVIAPDHAPVVGFLVRVEKHVLGHALREPLIRGQRERERQQSPGGMTEKMMRHSELHDLSPMFESKD